MHIPALAPVRHRMCACGRHIFDEHGDHVHTCKKYTRNRYDAHQILLKALQSICQRAGYVATIRNIPESRGQRRADLFVKDIKLAGMQDLVVDVSIIHEFHGDVMQDVRRNGTLCHPDPSSPAPLPDCLPQGLGQASPSLDRVFIGLWQVNLHGLPRVLTCLEPDQILGLLAFCKLWALTPPSAGPSGSAVRRRTGSG